MSSAKSLKTFCSQGHEIFDFAVSNVIKALRPILVRGAKALAKGDLGLNFLARGILESAFL
jgi:hypothetical protein